MGKWHGSPDPWVWFCYVRVASFEGAARKRGYRTPRFRLRLKRGYTPAPSAPGGRAPPLHSSSGGQRKGSGLVVCGDRVRFRCRHVFRPGRVFPWRGRRGSCLVCGRWRGGCALSWGKTGAARAGGRRFTAGPIADSGPAWGARLDLAQVGQRCAIEAGEVGLIALGVKDRGFREFGFSSGFHHSRVLPSSRRRR